MLISLKHLQILCLSIDLILIYFINKAIIEFILLVSIAFFAIVKISGNPEKIVENLQNFVEKLYEILFGKQ